MSSPRGTKRRGSWWSRNMVFPSGIERSTPSSPSSSHPPTPLHPLRPASAAACVCPCASCFNNTPRPQSYYMRPTRPRSSVSGTAATFSLPPRPYNTAQNQAAAAGSVSAAAAAAAAAASPRPPRLGTPGRGRKRTCAGNSLFGLANGRGRGGSRNGNRFSLMGVGRKTSCESLASDCAPLAGRGSPMAGMHEEGVVSGDGRSEVSVR
ncbi:hypothetical protein MKZ38_006308 [Zalerion maritima]|uniref:Uncharacterized protein n=1 Tax=Zalerion maritima TaxID=339359 RepID=A0AAD5WNH5_9PEZI|nr:hypothetical protein MKZ38_006308 [Zalerion maritima]